MRLAVLSDIHGNQLALQAVLDDLKNAGGADRTWILGDLVASLPRPAECMQIIRDLQTANPETVQVIGGNTDRYVVTGQRRGETIEKEEDWQKFPQMLRRRENFNLWTLERLTWADFQFITKILRHELELEVPGYGWVIGFHGAPGNDERNLLADMDDDLLLDALYDSEGRLAFGGHTHRAMDKDLGRWRLVNVGSIGYSVDGDPRATYALVTFEGDQAQVDLRRVTYDIEAVIRDMEQQQHPETAETAAVLRTGKVVA